MKSSGKERVGKVAKKTPKRRPSVRKVAKKASAPARRATRGTGRERKRGRAFVIPPDTRTLTKEEEKTLWRHYKKTRDGLARNRLLTHYQPLVRYAAERIKTRLPREIELDDLEAAGFFGLLDAVHGFDLSRGVKFETYCGARIRGAILDELRLQDWVPRLVRARANRLAWARGACEMELGRPPSGKEVADKLGCSVKEYAQLVREASTVGVFRVTQNPQDEESGRGVREIDGLQDNNGEDPSSETQREDLKELIMKGLNKKERLILYLYYYETLTMREIGHSLGLSESRVSQIHASLLIRLKKNLYERRPEFDIQPVPTPIG